MLSVDEAATRDFMCSVRVLIRAVLLRRDRGSSVLAECKQFNGEVSAPTVPDRRSPLKDSASKTRTPLAPESIFDFF